MKGWVINTDRAQCRDCYRCVRNCHVKAVKVASAQAEVVPERCIVCGTCVTECPQGAKRVRDDLSIVKAMVAAGQPVIASVAPSAPAFLHSQSFGEIRATLQLLGFVDASETAIGAELVGKEYGRLMNEWQEGDAPIIATACPTVVSLVEIYHPDLVHNLAPIVSPMIAHARWLKDQYDADIKVVFIGPCIGKKAEMQDQRVTGAVDAVLTFDEVETWMAEKNVHVKARPVPNGGEGMTARLFPVEGGLLKTAKLSTDVLATDVIAASGLANCEEALGAIRAGELHARLVELMSCQGGCVNGPRMPKHESVYTRREWIIQYAALRDSTPALGSEPPALDREFTNRGLQLEPVSEVVLKSVLAKIEKYTPDDELNCSACGYNSCRDKAEATYRGMAEEGMCVPYMRRKAESLANVVMEVVPTAVIVLNHNLEIQEISPSAEPVLGVSRPQALGQHLSAFIPTATFEEVRSSTEPVLGRKSRYRDSLIVKEFVVPVKRSNLFVGILEDVTREEKHQAEILRIRQNTIEQAQEVIDKQIRVAHEIASLLGETTAETKVQLTRMINVISQRERQA